MVIPKTANPALNWGRICAPEESLTEATRNFTSGIVTDFLAGQVIESKLSTDGKHTKELQFDRRDEDIMIYPADFQKIDGNRFIGRVSLKRNLYQPVLITSK